MTAPAATPFDPYLVLNVHPDITEQGLRSELQGVKLAAEQKTAFQLLCDKRYRSLFDKTDWDTVVAAGFITSFLDPFFSLECKIPLTKVILDKVEASPHKNDVNATVLLMTGAFDPAHQGHVNAMELARQKVEEQGQKVVAGLLSPTHQDYVRTKRRDAAGAISRIISCIRAIEGHDWLGVSPWESRHAYTYHNFTTVIDYHLSALQGVMRFPHVTYVFGEDNKDFSLAFEDDNDWICVERPQVPILSEREVNLVANDYAMSSTWVREGRFADALSHQE